MVETPAAKTRTTQGWFNVLTLSFAALGTLDLAVVASAFYEQAWGAAAVVAALLLAAHGMLALILAFRSRQGGS